MYAEACCPAGRYDSGCRRAARMPYLVGIFVRGHRRGAPSWFLGCTGAGAGRCFVEDRGSAAAEVSVVETQAEPAADIRVAARADRPAAVVGNQFEGS